MGVPWTPAPSAVAVPAAVPLVSTPAPSVPLPFPGRIACLPTKASQPCPAAELQWLNPLTSRLCTAVYSHNVDNQEWSLTLGQGTAAERTITVPYGYPRGKYRTMVYALVRSLLLLKALHSVVVLAVVPALHVQRVCGCASVQSRRRPPVQTPSRACSLLHHCSQAWTTFCCCFVTMVSGVVGNGR